MSRLKSPEALNFVLQLDQSESKNIAVPSFNGGIPTGCRLYTPLESVYMRKYAIQGGELAPYIRFLDQSFLNSEGKISGARMSLGNVKVSDDKNSCVTDYQPLKVHEFQRTFYTKLTYLNSAICPKELRGTKYIDWVGNSVSEEIDLEGSTLAEMMTAKTIETYQKDFIDKYALLAVNDAPFEGASGDDAFLAQIYHNQNKNYFHCLSFDLSESTNKYIQVKQGNKFYNKLFQPDMNNLNSIDFNVLSLIEFIEDLKSVQGLPLYTATFNTVTKKLYITSTEATREITLQIIAKDTPALSDFKLPNIKDYLLPTETVQNVMPYSEESLLFQFEAINTANFAQKFIQYVADFKKHLRNKGYEQSLINEVFCLIDPALLDQRDTQIRLKNQSAGTANSYTGGELGLPDSLFIPINALNDTGLFIMTVPNNFAICGDGIENPLEASSVAVETVKDLEKGKILTVDFEVPAGFVVDNFCLVATNILGSAWELNSGIAEAEPAAATRKNLPCFSEMSLSNCKDVAECYISAAPSVTYSYDSVSETTTVTVDLNLDLSEGYTADINANFALSEGTTATGITSEVFTFTTKGDLAQKML